MDELNYIGDLAEKAGFAPHTADLIKAATYAVESGEVALPFSQEEAEFAFITPDVIAVVDLLLAYPEFIQTAKELYIANGGTIG